MASYDIYSYGRMIRDEVRTNAYAEALRRSVTADSVVLDMGTGVGIWALLACQFGARKVYALEPNDVIHVARELAVANGFADRIEFIQDFSTNIILEEPADILVTEMHGITPMFENNLRSIIDARRRLLSPDGVLIPARETLWVSAVQAPRSFDDVIQPWANSPYGFRWQPALRAASNNWFKTKEDLAVTDCFAEPVCWATLEYASLESPHVSGEAILQATKSGTAHGLAIWFETELVDGIGFSNAPGRTRTIFGQGFFPWPQPVELIAGDQISVALRAEWFRGYHLWRWNTTITASPQGKQVKLQFRQSNVFELPLSRVAQSSNDSLPGLNENGQFRHFVFSLMNGKTSTEEIARRAAAEFPERFVGPAQATEAVTELIEKYGN